jgi:hypothetical protein
MRTAVAWVLGAVTLDALRWGNLPGGLGLDCKAAWTGHVGSTYPAGWAQLSFPICFPSIQMLFQSSDFTLPKYKLADVQTY